MRRIRELFLVNDIGMTFFILIIITLVIPINARRILFSGGPPCLYDFYISTGLLVVAYVIVPFVLFYILYVERYNFSAMMVIRQKNKYRIWYKCVMDLLKLCLIFSGYIYIVTTISGMAFTHRIYNWNEELSRCYDATRQFCEFPPSLALISIAFIVETFCVIFIIGLFMMVIWWLSDKKWVGFLSALIILFVELYDTVGVISKGIFYQHYVMSFRLYKKGINIGTNIIFPIVVSICVCAATFIVVRFKKKEFLST